MLLVGGATTVAGTASERVTAMDEHWPVVVFGVEKVWRG